MGDEADEGEEDLRLAVEVRRRRSGQRSSRSRQIEDEGVRGFVGTALTGFFQQGRATVVTRARRNKCF